MKVSVEGLREMVADIISEAKKKKDKEPKREVRPTGFSFEEALDFSSPLVTRSLYALQGASNWGPLTGDGLLSQAPANEAAVRGLVRSVIRESVDARSPEWAHVSPGPRNVWETAMHWYDSQRLGLGSQTTEGILKRKSENARKRGRRR